MTRVKIKGTNPIIVNSRAALAQLLEDQREAKLMGLDGPEKLTKEQAHELSYYKDKDGKFGVPVDGLQIMLQDAAPYIDKFLKKKVKGAVRILSKDPDVVPFSSHSKPYCYRRIVCLPNGGKKVPDIRYRGCFDKWEIEMEVEFNQNIITAAQIYNLFAIAGHQLGLCEWRPKFGRFEVAL